MDDNLAAIIEESKHGTKAKWKARVTRVVTMAVAAVTALVVSALLTAQLHSSHLCPATTDYCWMLSLYVLLPAAPVFGLLAGWRLPDAIRFQTGFARKVFGVPFGLGVGAAVGLVLAGCYLLLLLLWSL